MFKIILFFLWAGITIIVQAPVVALTKGPLSYILPPLLYRMLCFFAGIKTQVQGDPVHGKQVLYVSNHISYLDIPALGAHVRGSFVARGDLRSWPLFGYMATLQQTVFISRTPGDAEAGKNALHAMLKAGKSLILFAEGTSSDGTKALPFKSSMFSLAVDDTLNRDLLVQPVTISLIKADRTSLLDERSRPGQDPLSRQKARDYYAWYGDMDLHPHIKTFLAGKGATVRLTFHPPLAARDYSDRKALSKKCYEIVSSGLTAPAIEGTTKPAVAA